MFWGDRVQETSLTEGTGPLTLAGASATYQTVLNGIGNGKRLAYTIVCALTNQWEVGLGSATAGVLSRDIVLAGSSGAGTLVTFGTGVKAVFISVPATFLDGATRFKVACATVSTTNITVSTALVTGQVVNGVTLTAGMRVLVAGQSSVIQNGIYVAGAVPVRANDLYNGCQAAGIVVPVSASTNLPNGALYECVSASGSDIVNTNNLTFFQTSVAGLKASGVINDSSVPLAATVKDALNALYSMILASGGDVTGPTPSTTDAIAAYADTTGKLLENTSFILHKVTTLASVNQNKGQFNAWYDTLATLTFGSTTTLDMDAAVFFKLTLTGNTILDFERHSIGEMIVLLLIQDGTGGRSVTWPGSPVVINWNNGRTPVLDPTPGGSDLIILRCVGEDAYSNAIYQEECRKTSAPRLGISNATDGATVTFNLDVSPVWKEILGGSRTLALSGTILTGDMFMVKLKQDGTGSRLVTWFGTITWAGGTVPTLSTAANASDWFGFICTGANTYDGFILGQGM